MGEWKTQVPVKLDGRIVERLDRDVARFAPFCEGRSAVARVLIEVAYAAIDAGIINFELTDIQEVLSNPRRLNGQGEPSPPNLRSVPSVHKTKR